MSQPRYDLNLTEKSVGTDCRAELRMKDLYRDRSSVTNIVSKVYTSHPTPPDFTLDYISAGECFVQK